MFQTTRLLIRFAVFMSLMLALVSVAEACPNCKDGIANGNNLNLVRGYFWSIVFMMGMPFLLLGSIGTYFVVLHRKGRKQAMTEKDSSKDAN